MFASRRRLLANTVTAAGILAAYPSFLLPQSPSPQPRPSPNAPSNQNAPQGLERLPTGAPDQRAIDQAKQQEIKADVQKLYDLVSDLKTEIDRSNVSTTLSLPIVKKAQAIEKLAKQIKELAKG